MFREDVSRRFEWLYEGNPHGKAVTWIAYDDLGSDPVAVTSLFPRKVWVAGEVRTGSIGGDCYVLPRARRKGLATQLHKACIAQMANAGIDFMYGPPLPNNLRALVKAGAKEVGQYRRFTKFLTGKAAAEKLPSRMQILHPVVELGQRVFEKGWSVAAMGYSLVPINQFGSEYDKSVDWHGKEDINPIRDAEFLNWRYVVPREKKVHSFALQKSGELIGLAVLEIGNGEAVVVDLFCKNGKEGSHERAGLFLLGQRAKKLGATIVNFYGTHGSTPQGLLRAQGYFPRESRGFQVTLAEGSPFESTLLQAERWWFCEGDKDSPTSFSTEPV